jgi:DNA-binding beta-propeller fold protein YncE
VIVSGLLMALPLVGATPEVRPNLGHATFTPSLVVKSGTSCSVGAAPQYPTFDPVNHEIYVPNINSANLTILNGACKLVATVILPAGAQPFAAAFDPANNRVYVTDFSLEQVYVISGAKLVKTLKSSTFDGPIGIAYDPGDAVLAVANGKSNTVTFIGASTNRIVGTATVGREPYLLTYDPHSARLLVTNYDSNNVTSMSAAKPMDGKDNINIPVGRGPTGIAFDVTDSEDYVADALSNKVTVISGTGHHYGSVSVGSSPYGVVWDQAKLEVYVANGGSSTISVIQGFSVVRTIRGPSGAVLLGFAFDGATNQVFVTGDATSEVYIYG